MPYRLRARESASKNYRRIAREQMELTLRELSAPTVSPEGVHATRKALKRLRALLTCAEPALDAPEIRKRKAVLRSIGRMLAPQRDATIALQTARDLSQRFGADAAPIFVELTAHLEMTSGDLSKSLDAEVALEARRRLNLEAKKLAKIRLSGKGFEPLMVGIETVYRTARRAFKRAYEHPSDDAFHTLRKCVQMHWRHMSLLSNAWPDSFAVRIAAARELSQMLGDDHDVAIMLGCLGAMPDESRAEIAALCARRQQELREAARLRLALLFAERPKAFGKRMSQYWRFGAKMAARQRIARAIPTADCAESAAKPVEMAPTVQPKSATGS